MSSWIAVGCKSGLFVFKKIAGVRQSRWARLGIAVVLALALGLLFPTSQSTAACTVPNTISNGQVADASAVMGNFNALKNCADSAVTPSGTPAAGNLTVFSSSGAVTNGNLSGDCTTSGTPSVTCTKTNGSAFGPLATSTDAGQLSGTVSVARFNNGLNADSSHFLRGDGTWATPGGGAGASAWDFAPPAASSFPILATGDGTNLTLADDADEGLLVDSGVLTSGSDRFRTALKFLPSSGATDWEVVVKYKAANPGTANTSVGITARESATGKLCTVMFNTNGANPGMLFARSTMTSWGAIIGIQQAEQRIGWLRLVYVHSTGTLAGYWGVNGKQWQNLGSATNATCFTTRADQVGLEIQANADGVSNYMSVPYWRQSF